MSEPARPPGRLTRRAEFVHVARGWRVHRPAFSLQVARRPTGPDIERMAEARIGFTVTRKVGNAVVRNRIRRRMREAVRHCEALPTERQTDYVVVARREALTIRFETLMGDLADAVRRSAHRSGPRKPRADRSTAEPSVPPPR